MTAGPLGLEGWHSLALFTVATFVLNATPGVDLLLTVSRTLQGGPRAGVAAALGVNAGCVVHAMAAAFGLAALLAASATAFTAIRWAGAAYLLWLAWQMARAAWQGGGDSAGGPATAAAARNVAADFRLGFVTNVLNPKVTLFFLAFLPPFIPPAVPDKLPLFLALGAWFVVQSTLFLLLVVALTARLRRLGGSPRLTRALQGTAALLFAGLAWRMATQR